MIIINKYGKNIDLSNVKEINGKKEFQLDGIDSNDKLIIKVPAGVSYTSSLNENDVLINFKENSEIFELKLKNLAQILAQNDEDTLVEIIREDTDQVLSSISDLNSALQAAAAGPQQDTFNNNNDTNRSSEITNEEYSLDNTYNNASISESTLFNEDENDLFNLLNFVQSNTENDTPINQDVNDTPITQNVNNAPVNQDVSVEIDESALDDSIAPDYMYAGQLSGSDADGDLLKYEYANNLAMTLSTQRADIFELLNDNSPEALAALKSKLINFISNDMVDTIIDNSATLTTVVAGIQNATSINQIKAMINASDKLELTQDTLSLTMGINDTKAQFLADSNYFNIDIADNGSYTVRSPLFNSLAVGESVTVNFNYESNDGTVNSQEKTISLKVNGTNDIPIITEKAPILDTINENDFKKLAKYENGYYIIKQKEVFDLLEVKDMDINDEISVSLTKNSSYFELNGNNVTSNKNGVVQLTQEFLDRNDFDAEPGDFIVYSTEFNSMNEDDITKVQFEVKVFDGTVYSDEVAIVSIDVKGNGELSLVNNSLEFEGYNEINLADILENTQLNFEISDVNSINLSNGEHILSNITIEDFESMVSDTPSNILNIDGENNDIVKLDLNVWQKDISDTDTNLNVDATDDGYITYLATGTDNQVLTLLIDKDISVENI